MILQFIELISLIRTMMFLSYDGDGALERIGHGKGDDCSPAGKLGYLPRVFVLAVGHAQDDTISAGDQRTGLEPDV